MNTSTLNIPFNKPYISGNEINYIELAVKSGKISGNGEYTQKCQQFFENRYNVNKVLLTTSCTDALEMAAMLINIQPGDEVIVPSYTFVSSALAFTRMGAKIIFVDSQNSHPNLDSSTLSSLITNKTKAIVAVHYAGVACNMAEIMQIATKHNLFVIEDAAQAIESKFNNKQLGTIGHFGCFSFHETKNIQCGEGGMLFINEEKYAHRAEVLWEKGTNRSSFFRGEINKYGWVDTGSSFLMSDILAAYLYAQLENLEQIQAKRLAIWNTYNTFFNQLNSPLFNLPSIPSFATNNAHMYYISCSSLHIRNEFIQFLKANGIYAVFHYQSLHSSDFMASQNQQHLPNSDFFSNCLVRLPLYAELEINQVKNITSSINNFSNTFINEF